MNILAIVTGVLVLLAFIAHAIAGGTEFKQFAPDPGARPRQAWVQALAGWHWVSVDLLGAGTLFLLIGATDFIRHEDTLLTALSVYFAACGVAWLLVVTIAGRGVPRRHVVLGQWVFCLVVAVLAWFA